MSVREVNAGLYRIEEDDGGRSLCQFLVVGGDLALIVDSGLPETPRRAILPLLEELDGRRRLTVLLTHPDADHCGGTSALLAARPEADVLAHAFDCRLFGHPERTLSERYEAFAASDNMRMEGTALERMRTRLGGQYRVTRQLERDVEVNIGDRHCLVLHLPGHSAGHTALWLPEEKILIAGDSVMGTGIRKRDGTMLYAPQFVSSLMYEQTVNRVQELEPRLLLCAHEPARSGSAVLDFLSESRTAVEELRGLVMDALQAGCTTLAPICAYVHARYREPPEGEAGTLAMSVDAILGEAVLAGRASVDASSVPRRFVPVAQ